MSKKKLLFSRWTRDGRKARGLRSPVIGNMKNLKGIFLFGMTVLLIVGVVLNTTLDKKRELLQNFEAIKENVKSIRIEIDPDNLKPRPTPSALVFDREVEGTPRCPRCNRLMIQDPGGYRISTGRVLPSNPPIIFWFKGKWGCPTQGCSTNW